MSQQRAVPLTLLPRDARARVYSKDRVLYPHIKSDGKSRSDFRRVNWNEVIQFVTKKLRDVIDEYRQDSVLLYDYPGNQGFLTCARAAHTDNEVSIV